MEKLVLIILGCCLVACNHSSRKKSDPEKHDFFPVVSFLKAQVREVDSLKRPIYKYHTVNNKTDSALLSRDEFNKLAAEFMNPDINDPSIKKFYTETSFADQSIPNVTFTYSTSYRELPLQRVDIIINPDPVLNDQVNSIYLEKITKNRDTSIVTKLYWKANRNFQIISSWKTSNHPAMFSQVKVVWNTTD